MDYPWHLYLLGALYVFAGILHFVVPKVYLRIMPSYLPNHRLLVFLSGLAEVLLGLGLCFAPTKNVAVIGIILMLTVFLMVHFYMLRGKKESAGLPKWILILRIPLQFVLMYWAHSYFGI